LFELWQRIGIIITTAVHALSCYEKDGIVRWLSLLHWILKITGLAALLSVRPIFGLNNCEYAGIGPTGSAITRQHGDYELYLFRPVILLGAIMWKRSNHSATNGSCYTNVTDELTQNS
jgi:hypothetical protein